MWVNVKFYDDQNNVVAEHGHYDHNTATLYGDDTKVYEMKLGMDENVAAATGLEPGKSFHLVLNNVVLKDNRIPPVGFTNAAYESVLAQPVDYAYEDGQHWDDTHFEIPRRATSAVATLYFQTTSREYIEFLRDQNVTDFTGIIAYDLWESQGRSAPLDMGSLVIDLDARPSNPADLNGDGVVDVSDLLILLSNWGQCPPGDECLGDINNDGVVNISDLLILLANWG